MQNYGIKEFKNILKQNGFKLDRMNGSHSVFVHSDGRHISVPIEIIGPMAKRLIKENNLKV
jgi:predicted RNA binding protein YcfA (HicA-like mRNA interferase family)